MSDCNECVAMALERLVSCFRSKPHNGNLDLSGTIQAVEDEVEALRSSSPKQYEAPRVANAVLKVRGVGRVADEPRAMLVALSERPTDDEMRTVHEALRGLFDAPPSPKPGQKLELYSPEIGADGKPNGVWWRNTAAEAVIKWAVKYAYAPFDSDSYHYEKLAEAVAALDQQGRSKDG